MADTDTQIHPLGTVTAPGDFVIPGSAKLKLKGVYASFNGASAASSYKPLVRFISDAGSVALEAVADDTIAAGASADASWFPRVAAAAGGGAQIGGAFGLYQSSLVTIPAGATVDVDFVFAFGTDLLDTTDPIHPTVKTAGIYWVGVTFAAAVNFTAGAGLEGFIAGYPTGPQATAKAVTPTGNLQPEGFIAETLKLAPGDHIYCGLSNLDTVSRTATMQEASIVLLAA